MNETGALGTRHSAFGTVDYLLIGHVCLDDTPAGPRLGGTVAYAALAAQRLGRRVAVVTSAADDLDLAALLPSVAVHCVPAPATTRFRNTYHGGVRQQMILARAADLALDAVPATWRAAPLIHLAPVAQEVDPTLARALRAWGSILAAQEPATDQRPPPSEEAHTERAPGQFIGATPQGWLRAWDTSGAVSPQPAGDLPQQWDALDALALSEEDLGADDRGARHLVATAPCLALTRGADGVRVFMHGRATDVPACPARLCDPTGAGDVFAAVWFVRLASGDDPVAAARYAACAAACTVEQPGLAGVPTAQQIEERLAQWAA
jgi:sugar/nucleoside kinase (ribokinase family)